MLTRSSKRDLRAAAIELNNRGVRYLGKFEYKKAAPCFKTASKLMLEFIKGHSHANGTIVTDRNTALTLARDGDIVDERDEDVSTAMQSIVDRERDREEDNEGNLRGTITSASSEEDALQEDVSSETIQQRPKKRKKLNLSSEDGSKMVPGNCASPAAHVLGRPLWIKQEGAASSEEASPGSYYTSMHQSAIIIYNLGLAFHIGWSDATRIRSLSFPASTTLLLKAIELYTAAKRLVLSTPVNLALSSPVALVTLHNMAMAFFDLNRKPEAYECSNQLAKTLRLLRVDDHYSIFYLKLLQVGGIIGSLSCPAA
jgi:hypothetical protein